MNNYNIYTNLILEVFESLNQFLFCFYQLVPLQYIMIIFNEKHYLNINFKAIHTLNYTNGQP